MPKSQAFDIAIENDSRIGMIAENFKINFSNYHLNIKTSHISKKENDKYILNSSVLLKILMFKILSIIKTPKITRKKGKNSCEMTLNKTDFIQTFLEEKK